MYHLLWCLLGCFSKASVLVLWHKGISDETSRGDTHKNSWNTGDAQSADAEEKLYLFLYIVLTFIYLRWQCCESVLKCKHTVVILLSLFCLVASAAVAFRAQSGQRRL